MTIGSLLRHVGLDVKDEDIRVRNDPKPLPKYRQHMARLRAWWLRSRNQRKRALSHLTSAGRKGLTLAISGAGATLVSFGVYQIYAPAGYIAGGLLLWIIQWNYGQRGSVG